LHEERRRRIKHEEGHTFVQCVCVIGGGGKGKVTKEKEHREAKILETLHGA